jgi:fructose-bisphosphate aldolase class I
VNTQELKHIAGKIVADDKGLLAMDESNPTCEKRFAKWGIPQTVEARRAYRELIVTTPGLGECISGAILYDETIRQKKKDGTPFVKAITDAGIVPGIKVDTGAKDMAAHPGEKVTEGLDGLRGRLAEYSQMGARFAKWRAVIALGDGIPSRAASRPTRRRWLAMPRCARKRAWSPSSNRKCSWTASIRLTGAAR